MSHKSGKLALQHVALVRDRQSGDMGARECVEVTGRIGQNSSPSFCSHFHSFASNPRSSASPINLPATQAVRNHHWKLLFWWLITCVLSPSGVGSMDIFSVCNLKIIYWWKWQCSFSLLRHQPALRGVSNKTTSYTGCAKTISENEGFGQ